MVYCFSCFLLFVFIVVVVYGEEVCFLLVFFGLDNVLLLCVNFFCLEFEGKDGLLVVFLYIVMEGEVQVEDF